MIDVTDMSAYAETLFGGEDPALRSIRETAEREGIPTIQVPPELGRLLQLFIRQSRARRVLEIGGGLVSPVLPGAAMRWPMHRK